MSNLLRIIVDLAEDAEARAAYRADPEAVLAGLDDLTGEDVAAALTVAAVQVEPELGARLDDFVIAREPDASPGEQARRALEALCDELELAGVISFPTESVRHEDTVVPDGPPGRQRPAHLRAVDGDGVVDPDEDDDSSEHAAHLEHPSNATSLAPVPDPPGGFEFSVLEMVLLPAGLPDAGIEPGATATVVAVHHEPEFGYEIEVSGEDGGRRYLGVVPPSAVAPVPD